MNAKSILHNITSAGVTEKLNQLLKRKILLCNQIGASIGAFMLIAGLYQILFGISVVGPSMLVCGALYLLVLAFNYAGLYNVSRIYLCVLPPVLLVGLSGLVLHSDHSFKLSLVPVILAPLLLFGITERVKMGLGLAWVMLVFLTIDWITPLIPKVQDAELTAAQLALNVNINGFASFFMFSACFIYFQRINLIAESEIAAMLEILRSQNELITKQSQEELQQSALSLSKQVEINALKSTFLAMTSHEFRTPLTAILSSEELLRDFGDRLDDVNRQYLFHTIEISVRRMREMLDKVLIIGRSDANMLEFSPKMINLALLCRRLVDEATQHTESAVPVPLELQFDLAQEWVVADEELLRHCIGNLLSNAIKYSPQGGTAKLHVAPIKGAIQMVVTDNGIGIPTEAIPKLFENFHRAANVGQISGTGLGLAIAQRAAQRHGGTITVSPRSGGGTRFCVTIPESSLPNH
jgi:signal transduction histidine kinase